MYWPCNLRAARRWAESRSLRPRCEGFPGLAEAAAWSSGASRDSARAIELRDLRIDRTSMPTDVRRGVPKRASITDAAGEWYYGPSEGLSTEAGGRPTGFHGVPGL
jgi:hypothetical protein